MGFLNVADEKSVEMIDRALQITREVAFWFDRYDSTYEGHPNVRISRTVLCIAIGDEAIWVSSLNTTEQLTFNWVMREYRRVLTERYEPLEKWFADNTTFTGDSGQ